MEQAASTSLGFALSRDRQRPIHIPSHSPSLSKQQHTCRRGNLPKTSISTTPSLLLFTILFLLLCISSVHASKIYVPEQMVEGLGSRPSRQTRDDNNNNNNHVPEPEDVRSGIERRGSPPPEPSDSTLATFADDLERRNIDMQLGRHEERRRKRQVGGEQEITTRKATLVSNQQSTTSIISRKTSSSTEVVAAKDEPLSSPLPKPFDNGFNGNITESCQAFMDSMLTNSSFVTCSPFSLLLRNSNSFFQSSKSITLITRVLDTTCAADSTSCSNLLSSFTLDLPKDANCGSDLSSQNPLIQQAFLGLQFYLPLYKASCLRNPSTSSYCFADAITNETSPTDARIYHLPLNMSLPGGSQPTCNSCLQDTMAVFGAATGISGERVMLRNTYGDAADQINLLCGPNFVNASLAAPVQGLGIQSFGAPNGGMGMLALGVIVLSWFL